MFYPVDISTGTHRIGGWMGDSTEGMDAAEKRKF
jgi:hypothetical protein